MTRTFTITQSGVSRSFTVNNGVGPAGPNSVTSGTSTDLNGIIAGNGANVYEAVDGVDFLAPTSDGSGLTGLVSAQITDASTIPVYNETTELYDQVAVLYDDSGIVRASSFIADEYFSVQNALGQVTLSCDTSPINVTVGANVWRFNNPTGDGTRQWNLPTATSGTVALTGTASGIPDKLTNGTISGTLAVNSTSYTYGTGAAAAHRTALGVASSQLQTEALFSLLTLQESDAGVYTANAGTAVASADGDNLTLSASTANQRPNVYRLRNWSRNPGISSSANPVMPLKLASAGNIVHSGSAANGASFRCGIGMVNGASAVAANANATTGCGFGWRIAWNSTTSKLEFNLWAHDGTTYTEGTGIDTGLGASNLDGFFNVIVCLAADGTVTANTWFGINTALSTPSTTPTATLAGGPTSGTFANQGIPCWLVAAHSSTAPSGVNSITVKIINRKLGIG